VGYGNNLKLLMSDSYGKNILNERIKHIDEKYSKKVNISSHSTGVYYIKILKDNKVIGIRKLMKK
jgi:hypothetical protein